MFFSVVPRSPSCTEPSLLCRHSSVCLSQAQLCDGRKDCPEGDDEDSCLTTCLSKGQTSIPQFYTLIHCCKSLNITFAALLDSDDFRCQDGRSCISRNLVCDGRSHCQDGSDEFKCPSVTSTSAQEKLLKCQRGSKLCDDGRECVLYRHVCDGEMDCKDGSDEQGCGEFSKE